MIQASDSELYQNLEKINAVEIGGVWRLLHPDYDNRVFDAILDLISEHQWSTVVHYQLSSFTKCSKAHKNTSL